MIFTENGNKLLQTAVRNGMRTNGICSEDPCSHLYDPQIHWLVGLLVPIGQNLICTYFHNNTWEQSIMLCLIFSYSHLFCPGVNKDCVMLSFCSFFLFWWPSQSQARIKDYLFDDFMRRSKEGSGMKKVTIIL